MSNCCTCAGYHEMNLDWLISEIKKALSEWDVTKHEWEETKQYITDYFKNLDVQEEINNKLNEMATDGTLSSIILELWGPQVSLDFANSVGEMVDHSKNYVLISNSHIYYYNGSNWVDSGIVYGAVNSSSMINRGVITESTSLFDYNLPGYYVITSAVGATIQDSPFNGASVMLVLNVTGTASLRILYDVVYFKTWMQYGTNKWYALPSNNNSTLELGNSFATTNKNGFYFLTRSQISNFTDKPSTLNTGCVLINYIDNAQDRDLQIIISITGQLYILYDGVFLPVTSILNNGLMTENSSMFEYNNNGYYSFTTSTANTLTDKPETLTTGGIMINSQVDTSHIFRIILSTNYEIYMSYSNQNWKNIKESIRQKTLNYYALGDSITAGATHTSSGFEISSNPYPTIIANECGYVVNNLGVSSTGFLYKGSEGSSKNASDIVDSTSFTNCDICSIAYGTNDWRYSQTLGSSSDNAGSATVCGSLKHCIEKILTDNPTCAIYVITPLNRTDQGGNIETNYALSVQINNKTLDDFITEIKAVCDYYGIPCISQTKEYVINRFNINNSLSDGLHPTNDAYLAMGYMLASKINY